MDIISQTKVHFKKLKIIFLRLRDSYKDWIYIRLEDICRFKYDKKNYVKSIVVVEKIYLHCNPDTSFRVTI